MVLRLPTFPHHYLKNVCLITWIFEEKFNGYDSQRFSDFIPLKAFRGKHN